MFSRDRIEYKTPDEVRKMRASGLALAEILAEVKGAVVAGATTADLDAVARAAMLRLRVTPNFLNYHGFPGVLCTSVNDEVVHGIPGARELAPGDVVKVDGGCILDGWHSDSAFTVVIPGGNAARQAAHEKLSELTRLSMWHGIAAVHGHGRLNDIGCAIEDFIVSQVGDKYGIVDGLVGHGIGRSLHQPPEVVNFRTRQSGPKLKAGLVIAIEPMVIDGSPETVTLEDEWTIVSTDGGFASHWEHTVAVTPDGVWVLTEPDGGEAELAKLGVPVSAL
ncbi:type I methionyl aminopeptidase [Micrococcales bacterium 31B]|nr:type I methionyl aminopeptidase [Micrococcales bacterium 31B]